MVALPGPTHSKALIVGCVPPPVKALRMKRSPGVLPPSDTSPTVWTPVKPQPDVTGHEPSVAVWRPLVVTASWKNQSPMLVSPLLAKRSPPKKRTL